jgi:hypothetical protein
MEIAVRHLLYVFAPIYEHHKWQPIVSLSFHLFNYILLNSTKPAARPQWRLQPLLKRQYLLLIALRIRVIKHVRRVSSEVPHVPWRI